MFGYLSSILCLLGIVFVIKLSYSLLLQLHAGLKAYAFPLVLKKKNFRCQFGQWGLVTGCTQGIGREYAMGLAARGMDVILVSRNRNKLEEVQREIKAFYNVRTTVIVADFTDVEIIPVVVKKVKELDIDLGILVNNVGTAGEHMMPFLDQDEATVANMITVNMTVITMLTHALLPAMKKKGRGAVINISSVASLHPMPYIAVYAATKHYIHAFTEALAYENRDSGVLFQEVTPGAVETALTKYLPRSRFTFRAAPLEFVCSALSTLGYTSRTCGWWPHSLQLLVLQSLPDLVMRRALEYTYGVIINNMREQNKK
eukprot:GFUD01044635.1.p1 GENE.GFUD01044635.1~~GFUD01044635.1.p1  ORF type:complete len:315 (-),score=67.28 GFUD01044635.1:264-1208(-)